jgi:ABC-type cobalamin/Fe3+-siderophores transport system ATPase subunit
MLKGGVAAGYGAAEEVFTAAKLRDVYEVEVTIGRNPVTGTLVVYPGSSMTERT